MGDWCIFVTPTIVNFRAILVQQTDEVSITLLKKVKNFTSSIDRGFLMGDPTHYDPTHFSEVRQRIVARYQAGSSLAFDFLSMIGRGCVWALQLLPKGKAPLNA